MTATLTPVGTPVDMTVYEEHWDDQPACKHGDKPAAVRTISRCCHVPLLLCADHQARHVARINKWLSWGGVVCNNCNAGFQPPATYSDVEEVIPL